MLSVWNLCEAWGYLDIELHSPAAVVEGRESHDNGRYIYLFFKKNQQFITWCLITVCGGWLYLNTWLPINNDKGRQEWMSSVQEAGFFDINIIQEAESSQVIL